MHFLWYISKNKDNMLRFLVLFFGLFISQIVVAQEEIPLEIGKKVSFHSTTLNEERILNIYLPADYSDSINYPCIYVLDGSMDEDFLHIVGVTQFFSLMFGMPPAIVIGIENVDRKRDFTFHTELEDLKKDFPTTGHSDAFIKFLKMEVQPYIQANFKCNEDRYIIGQSLGGLLATEILLKEPQMFNHYVIVSPSLWWDDESLLKSAKSTLEVQTNKPKYVFVAVGNKEGRIMESEAKKLSVVLKKTKLEAEVIAFQKMKKQNHATVLHSAVYEALLQLYPFKEF